MKTEADFIIIGAGIIGLAIARELIHRNPGNNIIVLEKEQDVAMHSSGRNSGVLHAGFYYTADSLKARFTKEGNKALTKYCDENKLRINKNRKIVVARNEAEVQTLHELENRGHKNRVDVELIDEEQVRAIDPNVKTFKKGLFSPATSTVDPTEICQCLKNELVASGVTFMFNESYKSHLNPLTVITNQGKAITAKKKIINCAGLYADKIAREYGFSKNYIIIPFKGIYLKYTGEKKLLSTNVYPVPNLNNPFLGVHYTVTVDNVVKIGPTAIPAFWRENYSGMAHFSVHEFMQVIGWESRLFLSNSFGFRNLAIDEVKKYRKKYFINLAREMVYDMDETGFDTWTEPGIRSQLLNVKTRELVRDFVLEGDEHTVHVLNAVSPAFTCSFPFAGWVVDGYC